MASDLLNNFEPEIESIVLIPSDGGRFEVIVNDHTIYSKLHTGRHAEPGEVVRLIKEFMR